MMVTHEFKYYGKAFRGFRGMNKGDPLSPTISNVVMDSVVTNLVLLVTGGAVGPNRWEGGGGDSTRRLLICHIWHGRIH